MKRSYIFMTIAVAMAAVTVISCQKVEEEIKSNNNEVHDKITEEPTISSLTFTISDNEVTKALIAESDSKKYSNWETGDVIGYVTSKSDKGSATVSIGTPDTFTISPATGLAVDNEVDVWYPYRKDETNKASVQMLIPVSQIQDGDNFDFDAMPMVAEPITITSEMLSGDDYAGTIDFANLASLIEFKVFSTEGTYASEKVAAITFDAGSSNIAGHFNMNVGAVDFDTPATLAISGYTAKSVTTSLTSPAAIGTSKATAKNVYMVVAPGTYTGNIIVATDAAFYTIPISGKEFDRSGFKSFGIDLAKNVATRRATKGSFTFQLDQISYTSASASSVVWDYGLLTMEHSRNGDKTEANNGIPPAYANSRFYSGNNLIFTPLTSTWTIDKVQMVATSDSYASVIKNSTWTNAVANSSGVNAFVLPDNSSSEFKTTALNNKAFFTSATVYFDNTAYTIAGASSPAAGGSFTIKKGDDVVSSAKANTIITLAASPNSGYSFTSWSVKDAENNDIDVVSNQFRMPASNVTITANFADAGVTYSVSFADYSHGTASASPSSSIAAGETVTITATPDAGYTLYSLTAVDAGDNDVTISPSKTFTMPSSNVTVTPVFKSYAPWTASSGAMGSKQIASVNGTTSGTVTTTAAGTTPSYTWSWTRTLKSLKSGKTDYIGWSDTDGIQLGSSNSDEEVVFTTSGITGTVKKIIVTCRGDNHRVSATVNGTAYISATNMTNSSAEYSGTGSSSGEIVITITPKSTSTYKACYIKQIEVIYE